MEATNSGAHQREHCSGLPTGINISIGHHYNILPISQFPDINGLIWITLYWYMLALDTLILVKIFIFECNHIKLFPCSVSLMRLRLCLKHKHLHYYTMVKNER